jgi:hypothetical protein
MAAAVTVTMPTSIARRTATFAAVFPPALKCREHQATYGNSSSKDKTGEVNPFFIGQFSVRVPLRFLLPIVRRVLNFSLKGLVAGIQNSFYPSKNAMPVNARAID